MRYKESYKKQKAVFLLQLNTYLKMKKVNKGWHDKPIGDSGSSMLFNFYGNCIFVQELHALTVLLPPMRTVESPALPSPGTSAFKFLNMLVPKEISLSIIVNSFFKMQVVQDTNPLNSPALVFLK